MELAARYQGISYYGTPAQNSSSGSSDFQVRKLTLAIKVKPFWGVSLGVLPFSTSSYSFYANKSIQGTVILNQTYYQGSGGLNQYFITNSFNIIDRAKQHLSVGVQTSYLAGSFMQTESLDSLTLGTSLNTTRNIYMAKFYAKAGILYQTQLTKKWSLGIGATASEKTMLNNEYYLTVVSQGQTIVNNQTVTSTNFTVPEIPLMYGGGISLVHNNSLTLSGDYQFQNWGSLNYTGLGFVLVNSHRYSAGVQFAKTQGYGNTFIEHSNLQAGIYYGNSYINVNGYQLKDYGITLGAGFTSKSGAVGSQFYLQIGQTGTTQNGLIKEEYVQIGVNLSYKEVWLTRLRKYF